MLMKCEQNRQMCDNVCISENSVHLLVITSLFLYFPYMNGTLEEQISIDWDITENVLTNWWVGRWVEHWPLTEVQYLRTGGSHN